jgi:hypothetical protein
MAGPCKVVGGAAEAVVDDAPPPTPGSPTAPRPRLLRHPAPPSPATRPGAGRARWPGLSEVSGRRVRLPPPGCPRPSAPPPPPPPPRPRLPGGEPPSARETHVEEGAPPARFAPAIPAYQTPTRWTKMAAYSVCRRHRRCWGLKTEAQEPRRQSRLPAHHRSRFARRLPPTGTQESDCRPGECQPRSNPHSQLDHCLPLYCLAARQTLPRWRAQRRQGEQPEGSPRSPPRLAASAASHFPRSATAQRAAPPCSVVMVARRQ